jgi:hypothetical protein
MKAYVGDDVQIHIFLTSALIGAEWLASRSGRFILGERASGSHWIRRWVGPKIDLEDTERRENSCPYRDSHSDPSVFQLVASRYTDCAIPASSLMYTKMIIFTMENG